VSIAVPSSARAWRASWWWVALLLAFALVVTMLYALGSGRFELPLSDVLRILAGQALPADGAGRAMAETVLWQIRGPRILASITVGAALAASGVALQSVFRNPLAAPDLLGVSAGAALGAVAGIFLGWTVFAIQGAAFVGGLVAVSIVYSVGTLLPLHDRTLSLVLAGIAIGSVLGALIALVKTLADPYFDHRTRSRAARVVRVRRGRAARLDALARRRARVVGRRDPRAGRAPSGAAACARRRRDSCDQCDGGGRRRDRLDRTRRPARGAPARRCVVRARAAGVDAARRMADARHRHDRSQHRGLRSAARGAHRADRRTGAVRADARALA